MGVTDGHIISTSKEVNHGPSSSKWNLVVLSDGYQDAEITKFHSDFQNFINTLQDTKPFDEVWNGINIYRVDVASTDSGADNPQTCGDGNISLGVTRATYFDSTFCSDGNIRRLLACNTDLALSTAMAQVPHMNLTAVLVNDSNYGGSGGKVAVFSTYPDSVNIGIHELAHTAFNLADEYADIQGCTDKLTGHDHYQGIEPMEPNVTKETDFTKIKWRDLINADTHIPTTNKFDCSHCDPASSPVQPGTVGLFEGARYYHCDCYRSEYDCKMRTLAQPFCTVCQKAIKDFLAQYVFENMYFIVNKSTFGVNEVANLITTSQSKQAVFSDAFWLVLDGFTKQETDGIDPLFSYSIPADLVLTQKTREYETASMTARQRILIPYDITFLSTNPFPPLGSPPVTQLVESTFTVDDFGLDAITLLELVADSDPYFTNVDSLINNQAYLSQDLRVFSAVNGDNPFNDEFGGIGQFTGDPYLFIQNLLTYLNNNYKTQSTFDSLDYLVDQDNRNNPGDSSVTPKDENGNDNFNFAIARVRLRGSQGPAASNVRVFFRLFISQSCDTDFQPSTTYQSILLNDKPQYPQPSGSGLLDPSGQFIQTIPFFATVGGIADYVLNSNMNNIHDISISNSDEEEWAYFGCFLDVYNPLINWTFTGGTHHCLVAEIAYDDSPIINSDGVTMSPFNSDKLAQRNLVITRSGNPNFPSTHRIPQTFDMRPSPLVDSNAGLLLNYPDELMIDWGNVPAGTEAQIYWPQINMDDILKLAKQFYSTSFLSALDANTIKCEVSKGVTYIPIPAGIDKNFAGLFTVDLPVGISIGQEFNILVRRITSRQISKLPYLNSSVNERLKNKEGVMTNWRYTTGSFNVRIPVQTDEASLLPEENALAIFRWRLEKMSSVNRWYPVHTRYISYIASRVDGFGGNSKLIKGSPTGVPFKPKSHSKFYYEGRVCEVFYNCSGDFEGFVLKICCSKKKPFKCKEKAIGELILKACKKRWLIKVYTEKKDESKICEIGICCSFGIIRYILSCLKI